ncbi:hypothetical protein CMI45_01710 [Candidatus Pacearchaeota archaeon]|nr:hypothetical protein [Candidatus Pacearchaeota archaeon]|tara:strand:+ start:2149 stop:2508 length:360 start_codon:yes stop_codon:yes gene_type:complete
MEDRETKVLDREKHIRGNVYREIFVGNSAFYVDVDECVDLNAGLIELPSVAWKRIDQSHREIRVQAVYDDEVLKSVTEAWFSAERDSYKRAMRPSARIFCLDSPNELSVRTGPQLDGEL